MGREIVVTGFPKGYRHYIERRLRYQTHFERLTRTVPIERLDRVSQERMARGIAEWIKAVVRGQTAAPIATGLTTRLRELCRQGVGDRVGGHPAGVAQGQGLTCRCRRREGHSCGALG